MAGVRCPTCQSPDTRFVRMHGRTSTGLWAHLGYSKKGAWIIRSWFACPRCRAFWCEENAKIPKA